MSVLKGVLEHAKRHVEYPTSKKALVEACNNFSDVPREDRDRFEKNLSERGYSEPIEVLKALLDRV
jgi:hypothetical protein